MKGSSFVTESTGEMELLAACAIARRKEKKVIAPGKTAGDIVFIILPLKVSFSKVPILRNLVTDYLKRIPNSSRDLILQKHMIWNTGKVSDYQMAVAGGSNIKLAADIAYNLFDGYGHIINAYMGNAILRKMFEVDPYVKAIWITLESADLVDVQMMKGRLKTCRILPKVLKGDRCQFQKAVDVTTQLKQKINTIIADYEA